MKKSILQTALFFISLCLLTSCFVTVQSNFYAKTNGEKVPIQQYDCDLNTPENVDVFYPTDSLDFNFTKIGFVTAYAALDIPDSSILNRLKYNSYLLCGNGVTEVLKSTIVKDNVTYTQFSASAVRIEKDSLYFSRHPNQDDFSFYHFSRNDVTYTSERAEFSPVGTILGLGATVAGIIIYNNSPKNDSYQEDDYYEDDEGDEWE